MRPLRRHGIALPIAVMVLLAISMMTLTLTSVSNQSLFLTHVQASEMSAQQAADGAMALLAQRVADTPTYGSPPSFANAESGTLEPQDSDEARPYVWTFDAAQPYHSINNVAGTTDQTYVGSDPLNGTVVPVGYALLVVSAWPQRNRNLGTPFGEAVRLAAMYRYGVAGAAATGAALNMANVSAPPGQRVSIYSNQAGGSPAIVLDSLLGSAYTVADAASNPVQIANPDPNGGTSVYYNQPPFLPFSIDVAALFPASYQAVPPSGPDPNAVIVYFDGKVVRSMPAGLDVSALTYTPGTGGAVGTFSLRGSGTLTLDGTGGKKFVFVGGLDFLAKSINLQNGVQVQAAGPITVRGGGTMVGANGTLIANGPVTLNGHAQIDKLSVIAAGDITMHGGAADLFQGFFYSSGNITVNGGNPGDAIQGMVMAPKGSVNAPNLDLIYDPTVLKNLQPVMKNSQLWLMRSAWWYV